MSDEFLEEYTAALNRATNLAVEIQQKGGILIAGVDDHLVSELEAANQEVDRLSALMLAMNQ